MTVVGYILSEISISEAYIKLRVFFAGLLIGTKGVTVKKLMGESGAYIIIRPHLFSDKHKICSIEGKWTILLLRLDDFHT